MLIKLNIFYVNNKFLEKQIKKIQYIDKSAQFIYEYLNKKIMKKTKHTKLVVTKQEYITICIYLHFICNINKRYFRFESKISEDKYMSIIYNQLVFYKFYANIIYMRNEEPVYNQFNNPFSYVRDMNIYFKKSFYIGNNNECLGKIIFDKTECNCIHYCPFRHRVINNIQYLYNLKEGYSIVISGDYISIINHDIAKYIYKMNIIFPKLMSCQTTQQNNEITYKPIIDKFDEYNTNINTQYPSLINNKNIIAHLSNKLFTTKINLPISKLLVKLLNNNILYATNKSKLIKIIYILKYYFTNITNYDIMIYRLINKIIIC